jgi:hypothetical protein
MRKEPPSHPIIAKTLSKAEQGKNIENHKNNIRFFNRNSKSQETKELCISRPEGNNYQPRFLFPVRLSFMTEGEIKNLPQ